MPAFWPAKPIKLIPLKRHKKSLEAVSHLPPRVLTAKLRDAFFFTEASKKLVTFEML